MRNSAHGASLALQWADLGVTDAPVTPQEARCMAVRQLHYIAGDNDREASYVVGFGDDPPQRHHHRSSNCAPWEHLEDPDSPCVKYASRTAFSRPDVRLKCRLRIQHIDTGEGVASSGTYVLYVDLWCLLIVSACVKCSGKVHEYMFIQVLCGRQQSPHSGSSPWREVLR